MCFPTYLVDLHSFDLACMSDMGTSAQVNQGPTSNQVLKKYKTVSLQSTKTQKELTHPLKIKAIINILSFKQLTYRL